MATGGGGEKAEPAFIHGRRGASSFKAEEVLTFDGGTVIVKGNLSADGGASSTALVTLHQKGALESEEDLLARLPRMELSLTDWSGAEYSYYDAVLPAAATDTEEDDAPSFQSSSSSSFSVEVIWPASEQQVQRKRRSEQIMVEEDPETYRSTVLPYVEEQTAKLQWIVEVCSLAKERERNLFACDDFIINVDTKWRTHAPFSTTTDDGENGRTGPADGASGDGASGDGASADGASGAAEAAQQEARRAWKGAPWTRDLYLLAISRDPGLRSLRDLRGEAGAALCDAMARELEAAARDVYGVAPHRCRIFFHYHPQFYRLHAHCNMVSQVNPGCEAERAHLLRTVAQNLRLSEGYYADHATLAYKVRAGEKLHKRLVAAGKAAQGGPAGD